MPQIADKERQAYFHSVIHAEMHSCLLPLSTHTVPHVKHRQACALYRPRAQPDMYMVYTIIPPPSNTPTQVQNISLTIQVPARRLICIHCQALRATPFSSIPSSSHKPPSLKISNHNNYLQLACFCSAGPFLSMPSRYCVQGEALHSSSILHAHYVLVLHVRHCRCLYS